ncbi:MAG: hypothetical protein Q8R16_02660 [bacterium]|nr:hypothetical protein [bacterium]
MTIEPCSLDRLLEGILRRIDREKRLRALRWQCLRGVFALAASIALVVVAARSVATDLAASGFFDFLALAIAYPSAALAVWRSLALALLESLPATGASVFLTMIFLALGCFASLLRFVRIVRAPTR